MKHQETLKTELENLRAENAELKQRIRDALEVIYEEPDDGPDPENDPKIDWERYVTRIQRILEQRIQAVS